VWVSLQGGELAESRPTSWRTGNMSKDANVDTVKACDKVESFNYVWRASETECGGWLRCLIGSDRHFGRSNVFCVLL
jgi:hypothetical protein